MWCSHTAGERPRPVTPRPPSHREVGKTEAQGQPNVQVSQVTPSLTSSDQQPGPWDCGTMGLWDPQIQTTLQESGPRAKRPRHPPPLCRSLGGNSDGVDGQGHPMLSTGRMWTLTSSCTGAHQQAGRSHRTQSHPPSRSASALASSGTRARPECSVASFPCPPAGDKGSEASAGQACLSLRSADGCLGNRRSTELA